MSKYRLCYIQYDSYKDVDLSKLYCLKGFDLTDIKTIDAFTMKFNNESELLDYLKRNDIISKNVKKLYITIDKKSKETGLYYNKKIFRGEILLFKEYIDLYDVSNIYKFLIGLNKDKDFYVDLCDNYIEKYRASYSKDRNSSTILSIFVALKKCVLNNYKGNYKEFIENIEDFINVEFYKINKELFLKHHEIERKKDKDGALKNYRNIHDFISFIEDRSYIFTKENKEIKSPNKEGLYLNGEEEFLSEDDLPYMIKGLSFKDKDYEDYVSQLKLDIKKLTKNIEDSDC